jgi:hypothetical protein
MTARFFCLGNSFMAILIQPPHSYMRNSAAICITVTNFFWAHEVIFFSIARSGGENAAA